jgi:hypothetical protein
MAPASPKGAPVNVVTTSKPKASDSSGEGAVARVPNAQERRELSVGPDDSRRSTELTPLVSTELWRAAAGLTAPLELGPDGAIYLATRDGTLEVVEATGKLRFSVALDGVTVGPLFVDERGNAYAATSTGLVVGIGAQGNRLFTYRSPVGVTAGLSFGPTLGLLLLGKNDVILGINRAAYPIFRFDSPEPIVTVPKELFGFCVAVTNSGKFFAKDRAGRRFVHAFGGDITQVERTANGDLWLLAGTKLIAFRHVSRPLFEVASARWIATRAFAVSTSNVAGAILTRDGEVRWLSPTGALTHEHTLDERTLDALELEEPTLALDDEDTVWFATKTPGVLGVSPSGNRTSTTFDDAIRGLRFDPPRRRLLVAFASGAVLSVAR